MSNETRPTVAQIVSNAIAYGFEWISDKVSKGDAQWTVPLVRHVDLDKIEATFGKRSVLDNMDGTSRHVTNQRIARDIKADNATASDLEIKTAIVENWLGMKSRRKTVVETKVPVFQYGGVDHTTLEAMREAATRDLTEKGYPEEMVAAFVSRLGATEVAAK